MDDRTQFLHNVTIFSTLDEEELLTLLEALYFKDYSEGEIIFREGDEGRELYIVEKGRIAITIRLPGGGERELDEVLTGDFFGEMSIFENAPRSATCYAKSDTSMMIIHQDAFGRLIDLSPEIAVKIMYNMLDITLKRLQNTNIFVSDIVHWGVEARKRAIMDELTGIYNRRYLDEVLKEEFKSAVDNKAYLSLLMVDLDHFRQLNENHGHAIGDFILKSVIDVFKRNLRMGDVLARYGGDELAVILPRTDQSDAQKLAIRICEEVEHIQLPGNEMRGGSRVTTSQGLATYPKDAGTIETLKKAADQALYRAKAEGRNRVSCADSYDAEK